MISKQEVKHIAKLARLELSEKETEKMQKALSAILDYVEMLNKLDVSGINAGSHYIQAENVMRDDIIHSQGLGSLRQIKGQFPAKDGGHLKVKEVL